MPLDAQYPGWQRALSAPKGQFTLLQTLEIVGDGLTRFLAKDHLATCSLGLEPGSGIHGITQGGKVYDVAATYIHCLQRLDQRGLLRLQAAIDFRGQERL